MTRARPLSMCRLRRQLVASRQGIGSHPPSHSKKAWRKPRRHVADRPITRPASVALARVTSGSGVADSQPKSRIFTSPLRVTNTLSGLRSRWTMPLEWAPSAHSRTEGPVRRRVAGDQDEGTERGCSSRICARAIGAHRISINANTPMTTRPDVGRHDIALLLHHVGDMSRSSWNVSAAFARRRIGDQLS